MKAFVLSILSLCVILPAAAYPVVMPNQVNALIGAKNRGGQQAAASNLQQIGQAMTMYLTSNDDKLPASFSDILEFVSNNTRIFVSATDRVSKPASGDTIKPENTSFAYVGDLGRADALRNAAATPIAFEKPWLLPPSQRNVSVLYADGHVDRIQLPARGGKSCQAVVKLLTAKLKDNALTAKLMKNAKAEDAARRKSK